MEAEIQTLQASSVCFKIVLAHQPLALGGTDMGDLLANHVEQFWFAAQF